MAKKSNLLTVLSCEVVDESEEQAVLEFVDLHRRHLVCGLCHRIVSLALASSSSMIHNYLYA